MKQKIKKCINLLQKAILGLSDRATVFFKSGCSIVLLALGGIYILCEQEVSAGGVGVSLYYAPMLDYILTALLIFWGGTFLLDIAEKEITAGQ